ncbi:hypothetical protein PLESTB_001540700 [Pleodorina starrii]|uniref:DUF3445 domain-containing n=1 Tax=Pleodorina starrii TaxID=330485 RepID=A0A9W6F843_9CHLO|nr:hypothetical protein PLESTM_001933100 [Pleodorina starrii]GLC59834.1 hypothetical protein PLESTB_001540700 [Pleodorina starrii]
MRILSLTASPRTLGRGSGSTWDVRQSRQLPRCSIQPRACPFKGLFNSKSEDLPFKGFPPGKPYRLLLGMREPEDPWLDVDEDDELLLEQLRQRAVHIRDRRNAVIQLVDEPLARQASWELLHQLLAELPQRYPHRFSVDGAVITNRLTGEAFDTAAPGVDPLEVAGRITQEDFCLMAPGELSYRLLGGVVCFPAHWSVLDKLGMELPEIHDPVPRWRSDAALPAQRFLSRLSADKPFIRWNWSLSPTQELHLSRFYSPPPSPTTAPPEDTRGIDFLQLRMERQYFHRLSLSGCVVFTIRTYLQPLRAAVQGRPRVAAALAGALRDLPYEHLQYKSNLQRRMPALLQMLDAVAAAAPEQGAGTASGAEAAAAAAEQAEQAMAKPVAAAAPMASTAAPAAERPAAPEHVARRTATAAHT